MRWIWIDRFEAFDSGQSAVAVKAVTAAEEHLHDLYPAYPVFPHSLVVEGFAQTAGILVGEAGGFKEKVILAKIGKADFSRLALPGDTIRYAATLDTFGDAGASVSGTATVAGEPMASISMMFSHIDQNMAGLDFPEHNFVFTPQFMELLDRTRAATKTSL
jgi:3-hydroxyacyl-[acyl-carrier-protein] dehydratase